jgi:hypothetical protein
LAIKFGVGDGDTARGVSTSDKHLATDFRDLDVINPDQVGARNSNGITSPNILGVELGDVDVPGESVNEMRGLVVRYQPTE